MRRLTVGVGAALALLSGPAAACEWHEMAAYAYDAPQRYSPFARAPVQEAPTEERSSAGQERDAGDQASQAQSVQNDRDAQAQERDQAGGSDRAESVLAARR